VCDIADIILEIVDARDPENTRSAVIEENAVKNGKKLIVIINKID